MLELPSPDQGSMVCIENLRDVFTARFPQASPQRIAALMAHFLAEVPPVMETAEERNSLAKYIEQLKAYAGAEYPDSQHPEAIKH